MVMTRAFKSLVAKDTESLLFSFSLHGEVTVEGTCLCTGVWAHACTDLGSTRTAVDGCGGPGPRYAQ